MAAIGTENHMESFFNCIFRDTKISAIKNILNFSKTSKERGNNTKVRTKQILGVMPNLKYTDEKFGTAAQQRFSICSYGYYFTLSNVSPTPTWIESHFILSPYKIII